jgi:hypothetical protein
MTEADIKDAVRARDGYRCTGCGMTNEEHFLLHGRQLDVHRVVPGSFYALDATCLTICRSCHGSQPARERGQPDLARNALPLAIRIPPELGAAFEAFLAAQRPAVSKVSAVTTALQDFLTKRGHWPPPPP